MNLEPVFSQFPRLETERLELRQLHLSDAASLYAVLADEEVTRYYDDETFTDISQVSGQIESWDIGYAARRSIRWSIVLKANSRVIGTCGYYGFHT